MVALVGVEPTIKSSEPYPRPLTQRINLAPHLGIEPRSTEFGARVSFHLDYWDLEEGKGVEPLRHMNSHHGFQDR